MSCLVLVVTCERLTVSMYQRILVPVDGSPTSLRGLDEAVKLAKLTGAHLRLVHVVDEFSFATGFEVYLADTITLLKQGGQQILKEARARVAAAGLEAETVLFESVGRRVSDFVCEAANAWKADLIVIGTHGRRGVGRWLLGSDAERIMREAPVPVLLVRGVPDAVDGSSLQPAQAGSSASAATA